MTGPLSSVLVAGLLMSPAELSIAIMPLSTQRLSPEQTSVLESWLRRAPGSLASHRVVVVDTILEQLGESAVEQAKACDDSSCMAQLGQSLGVDRLIQVNAGKLGEAIFLSARMIDVDAARVERRSSVSHAGTDGLADALAGLFADLLGSRDEGHAVGSTAVGAPAHIDETAYRHYLSSGMRYDVWAAQYNTDTESSALEIGKWTLTVLSALSIIGTVRGGAGDRGTWTWVGSGTLWLAASTLWAIDLYGFGDVPAELK